MKNPLKYVRKNILNLEPYSTARDEFKGGDIDIWVDANESPYDNGVNRYPDPRHKILKKRISEIKSVPEDTIFIGGAGSDEAIDLTYRIFCRPGIDKVIIPYPTYGVYSVAAEINDIEILNIPLEEDFSLPVDKIIHANAVDATIRLVWVCSPNNPTGNSFKHEEIIRLAEGFNGIVAVDEAYQDFSSQPSLLPKINDLGNIVVLQTFSKAWGLAGLRCGLAFAVTEIAAIYNNVKYPYNLNGPTQKQILQMIENSPEAHVKELINQRNFMAEALNRLNFVRKVWPSDANFLLVEFDEPDAIYGYLAANGVLPRNRSKTKGCGPSLRITVGTPQENIKILELLKKYNG